MAALAPAITVLSVGALSLAAFWPGILSDDSLDQWSQLLTFRITPYHPPIHTLTNWLITRVWLSPAAVAIVQIVALAAVLLVLGRACVAAGASRGLALATGIALAATPAVGILSVTLWKDVPYAIGMLGLSYVCWRIAVTRGEALASPLLVTGLVVSLSAVALYRHNGLPVAAGTALWIVALEAGRWRRAALAASVVAAAVIAAGLTLPARLLNTGAIHPVLTNQAPIHQVAAMAAAGVALREPDRQVVANLLPLDQWRTYYDCRSAMPILLHVPSAAFEREQDAFHIAWLHAVMDHPIVVARHLQCVSGFIWDPRLEPHAFTAMAIVVPNSVGLTTRPLSESANGLYWRIFTATLRSPIARNVFWGPFPHLVVVIGCAALGWWRIGRRALLPYVPAILHTIVLIPLIPSSEYRLQYPVVLVGLVAPLLYAGLRGGGLTTGRSSAR